MWRINVRIRFVWIVWRDISRNVWELIRILSSVRSTIVRRCFRLRLLSSCCRRRILRGFCILGRRIRRSWILTTNFAPSIFWLIKTRLRIAIGKQGWQADMSQMFILILRGLPPKIPREIEMRCDTEDSPGKNLLISSHQVPDPSNTENAPAANRPSRNQTGATTWPAKNADTNSAGSACGNTVNTTIATTTVSDVPACCSRGRMTYTHKGWNSAGCTCWFLSFWWCSCCVTWWYCRRIWLDVWSSTLAPGPMRNQIYASIDWQNVCAVRLSVAVE